MPPPGKSGAGETVAIKVLTGGDKGASEKERQECLAEAKIMAIMHHENVVSIRGVSFTTAANGDPEMQLVLEYCNGTFPRFLVFRN